MKSSLTALAVAIATVAVTIGASAAPAARARSAKPVRQPWMNASLQPDARVALLLPRMTRDEKLTMVFGQFATDFPPKQFRAPAGARQGSAGYIPGIARLGIPAQWQTDAGIGVASQGGALRKRGRTALPSNLAIAATWNPSVGYQGGAMIGAEARASGFNVMLAGGVNLTRDPRNGRNFEYGGEDPWLAGTMVGAQMAGIQSNHIISTVKHYAINDQETDRNGGNSVIDPKAAKMSDLLAFEIAIGKGDPGSVMCAYNHVNGPWACESPWLLTDVLRRDWGFRGYVMSDWGATHSTAPAIAAGLDQQSGYPFDEQPYYGANLKKALADGSVTPGQLDTMVSRILYAMFRHGVFDHPIKAAPMDFPAALLAKDKAISQAAAEEGIVLLKNERRLLPLVASAQKIVVIGGYADKGVLAGGGSSLVYPVEGNAVPDLEPKIWPGPIMYYPSAPLTELRRLLPGASITFVDGTDAAQAAAAARDADVAIVFANRWEGEAFDVPLGLPDNQDALIRAVADANAKTVVVLQSGGPVLTPWAGKVGALLAAWFPGSGGGAAIARVLTGQVNPSGRLPVSFPRSANQLPRPEAPAKGDVVYREGELVGYKWYQSRRETPAFPFGFGLSYTDFGYANLQAVENRGAVRVSFTATNGGAVAGKAVGQVYASRQGWQSPMRLVGYAKAELDPGQSRTMTVDLDPRLFADWDERGNCWHVASGSYRLMLGASSEQLTDRASVELREGDFGGIRGFCRR